MNVYNDILLTINTLIESNKLDKSDVADGTGISRSTLYNYLKGQTPLTLENYIKICKFLKIEPSTLFPESKKREQSGIDVAFDNLKNEIKNYIDSKIK